MAVVFGLACAVIALVILLAYLADQVVRDKSIEKADHAVCVSHVSDVASRRIVAMAIRDLAERYDSPTGQRELHLARDRWLPQQGSSIPALWLQGQADRIEGGV